MIDKEPKMGLKWKLLEKTKHLIPAGHHVGEGVFFGGIVL